MGTWQVSRYYEKSSIVEEHKKNMLDEARPFPVEIEPSETNQWLKKFHGLKVVLEGEFDHSREVKLGLRTAPLSTLANPAQGMASNPQVSHR